MNTDYSFFNYPIFRIAEKKHLSKKIEIRPILVLTAPADYHAETRTLLSNILKAIHVDLATQTHLLLPESDVIYDWQDYPAHLILSFGVPLKKIGLNYTIPHYQLFMYQQQSFLCVDALSKIAQGKPLKAALWQALKNFSVEE